MWGLLCNTKQWRHTTTPVSRCRESNAFDTNGVCVFIPNMALMIRVYSEQLCSQQRAQWHEGLPDQPRDWRDLGCPGWLLKDAGYSHPRRRAAEQEVEAMWRSRCLLSPWAGVHLENTKPFTTTVLFFYSYSSQWGVTLHTVLLW